MLPKCIIRLKEALGHNPDKQTVYSRPLILLCIHNARISSICRGDALHAGLALKRRGSGSHATPGINPYDAVSDSGHADVFVRIIFAPTPTA